MIFVILGTEKYPFDRLVKEVDRLVERKSVVEDVFMQLGSCKYEPKFCNFERFLSFEIMQKKINEADLIIAHAGAGTTLLCVQMGQKPIIVPRQKKFMEHVDDHQISFSRKMETTKLVDIVYDIDQLEKCYNNHKNSTKEIILSSSKEKLINYLHKICSSWKNKENALNK